MSGQEARPEDPTSRARLRTYRVTTKPELRDFIRLTARIADLRGESDQVVPLFASDIADWSSGSGWFAEEVELWLLTDDSGAAVGRVMCHRSRLLAERLCDGPGAQAPQTLFFGALEALDGSVLEEIIALILSRAQALGATRVFGPVSPLPNVTGGLVTAGFEHPGFFDTAWNPAFVASGFADAGFSPWGPAQTWEVRVDRIPHARATAVSPAEWAERGLRRRPVSRLRMRAFAARLLPTLNSSFAALPYFTQISPAQLHAQMAGLSALADPSLIVDVVGADEDDDAPTRCFALVIPDPVPVLRRHGGRLGPAAIGDLLRHRSRLRDAVLIIQGTEPRFQGQGLLSLVTREVYSALAAGGYRRLRVTFIAEDNPASAAVFSKAGGTPLHGLCFLDRRLGEDEPAPAQTTAGAPVARTTAGGPVAQASPVTVDTERLASLFRTAGRAPSAHNTQPWVPTVTVIAEDAARAEVVLTVDPDRTLPVGDPRSEDLHLSLGCWVEALSIAAAEEGLTVEVAAVDGWGPDLRVGLHVGRLEAGRGSPGQPQFTVADLEHRQVDRGPLARDETAFADALKTANTALAASGARLVEIPDGRWTGLLRAAEHWSLSTAPVFAETLDWLRFDPADPAYREDGLNAECLRIPPAAARAAALLNRRRLRPGIARVLSAALAPAGWLHRMRPGPDTADADLPTGAPHHLVLAVTETGEPDAARELDLGRALLRTWLLLDRAGLRVDVHSEIKDCPDTHALLRDHLGEGEHRRPLATFSVGRSTTRVPRSPRRRT
ncbi:MULTISPECIES: nitroreductase family protein [Brevibacterium]|uniref:N-acetyltransferase domain-containing protein n=2 Tax=Brevibacterium TaxID=1696 RepID=A0ABP9U083_9MICO